MPCLRARPGVLLCVAERGAGLGLLLDRVVPAARGFALPPGWRRWHAWMLGFDTAQAGLTDVLLEPDDRLCERFGMVQTWNGIDVPLPAADVPLPAADVPQPFRAIGRLTAGRLAAVRAVAREWQISKGLETRIDPEIRSCPGRVGLRDALPGMSVLTGTPVASDILGRDARIAYRQVFRGAALAMRERLREACRVQA
ncbi:hypothetical protein GCM10023144_43810 [Pigmentiphaga soli]|uniref:Uncharacterized protein n=1 Tax=Pigmentiphaga soli TaxID=1007095 RepID=A0ABP8HP58_9BURK